MKNKEMKKPMPTELDEDALSNVSGGMDDDGWYWGYGFPPDYLNACPKCGGGVYSTPAPEALGGGVVYTCGPCGWTGRSADELAPGYTNN